MTRQDQVVRALACGRVSFRPRAVYGRIVRTELDQPSTLTEDEGRKVVMIMGPSGLQQLLGRTGLERLKKIGYSENYIARNIARGKKFKLVLFDRPPNLRVATWAVAVQVVAQHYPELAPMLHAALPELRRRSIEYFEAEAGYSFYDAQLRGSNDSRFMTAERLLHSKGTAADVRAFLFHTMHFSELYTGDGYTRTPEGKRGVREYIMSNLPIQSLRNCSIVDLLVDAPVSCS